MSRNPWAKLEDGLVSQSVHCKYVNWVKKRNIFLIQNKKNVYETCFKETGKDM